MIWTREASSVIRTRYAQEKLTVHRATRIPYRDLNERAHSVRESEISTGMNVFTMDFMVTDPSALDFHIPRRKFSLSVGGVIGGNPEPGISAPCVGDVIVTVEGGNGPKPPRFPPVDAMYPELKNYRIRQ